MAVEALLLALMVLACAALALGGTATPVGARLGTPEDLLAGPDPCGTSLWWPEIETRPG